jgi:hypothetical protein
METAKRALNRILELLPHGDDERDSTVPHETLEMYATVVPDAAFFGDHELEGLVTYIDRYAITLCNEGRVYDVLLRTATRYQPSGSVRLGAFVRIHGAWADDGFHANRITRIG